MFDTIGGLASQKAMAEPCKPDPEDMLQNARARIQKIEIDIKNFESMDDYYIPGSEHLTLLALYGAMHKALYEAKQAEEYWLAEIDK